MNWTRPLIELLSADFGGFPTFCHDPDGILEIPIAREAVRAAGLQIEDWNGGEKGLSVWSEVDEQSKPLIIVENVASKRLIESHLPDYRWQTLGIGDIFPAFAPQIMRELPVELWGDAYDLGANQFQRLSTDETLDWIGRGLYGLDPRHLRFGDGWWTAWLEVAGHEHGWPLAVAEWAAHQAPSPWVDTQRLIQTLTTPDIARAHLLALQNERPDVVENLSPLIRAGLERLAPRTQTDVNAAIPQALEAHFNLESELKSENPVAQVLEFALRFTAALSRGSVSEANHVRADALFAAWLQRNYAMAATAAGAPSLPRLVSQLDEESGATPLLLIVVDSLGLRAWQTVKEVWLDQKVIGGCRERAALAVVPTITSLSRRALFEGKWPANFGGEAHSQSLERKLWKNRFAARGDYFAPVEHLGISDAFATRRPRVAIVDVQWDNKGHAIDPRFETIEEEAEKWATRTDMKRVISQALQSGYRVVLTSDHGQVACRGIGRPNVGETVSERSKRCLIFRSVELRDQGFMPETLAWTPTGLDEKTHTLFPANFASFDYNGARSVSHGGLSLEEVVVPVVDLIRD